MKKKETSRRKFSLLLFLFSMVILNSCTKDNSSEYLSNQKNLRNTFLKNKDFATIKEDFNNLNENEKINLWDEKLDQLLTLDLPNEHLTLIKELKFELKRTPIDIEYISDLSVQLANITPEDDFFKMFTTLDNYKFDGHFTGTTEVNEVIKNSIKLLRFNYLKNVTNTTTAKTNGGKPCNCNWTCSLYVGGSTSKCTPTTSGCGFLWAFECEERVGPMLEPFPDDEESEAPLRM